MSTKIRAIMLMAAVAVFASLMVAPASAADSGVGVFQGNAEVGKWFLESNDCDKTGSAAVTGRGLYLPGTRTTGETNGADSREEDGVWHFGTNGNAIVGTNPLPQPFSLEACGWLGPVLDLTGREDRFTLLRSGIGGASCGNSKGHHGQGLVTFPVLGRSLKLYDVGWKASAGGTLPVNGRYEEYTGAGPTKAGKYGVVVALVQAQGGAGCTGLKQAATNNGNGAQSFVIAGVTALINTDGTELPDPKEGVIPGGWPTGKNCKSAGPAATVDGTGKKSHDNKPDPAYDAECDGGEK